MSQLNADCLNEIFEYLENENKTLRSCLLVNRLWCEVAIRILWRNSKNYCSLDFRTLISCLPNKSKEILRNNDIIISTPTSKPPMFNYASFCKILSIHEVRNMIEQLLKDQQFISWNLKNVVDILTQEILKLFVKQILYLV